MMDTEDFISPSGGQASVFGRSLSDQHLDCQQDGEATARPSRFLGVRVSAAVVKDYVSFAEETTVAQILRKNEDDPDNVQYDVRFQDKSTDVLSFQDLFKYKNGEVALQRWEHGSELEDAEAESEEISGGPSEVSSEEDADIGGRPGRLRRPTNFVEMDDDDDELSIAPARLPRRTATQTRLSKQAVSRSRSSRTSSTQNTSLSSDGNASSSSAAGFKRKRRPTRTSSSRNLRQRHAAAADDDEDDDELIHLVDEDESSSEDDSLMRSDIKPRTRASNGAKGIKRGRGRPSLGNMSRASQKYQKLNTGIRQSARSNRHVQSMQDPSLGDIYRSDSDEPRAPPKAQGAREAFQPLPSTHTFHLRHCQQCDTCDRSSGGSGQLVYCQGCTLSYHKHCLGNRTTRDHLVTKIGEADFVLQCRRCVNVARGKDPTAPDLGACFSCREAGPSCRPFRRKKTPLQEEQERNKNDGEDPIKDVDPGLVNNAANVLFRCTGCWRACHFHHLKSRSNFVTLDTNEDQVAERRFQEHRGDWLCSECVDRPAKVSSLVAWRPVNPDYYDPELSVSETNEDIKEYLVKWEDKSHHQCVWMPGPWVWGVTAPGTRKAFAKRVDGKGPIMNTEDAIPEEYLRIDIVLDIKYTSKVETNEEEVDKARIREVDQALMKFKGLGYEDAVWEKVPTPDDGDRWSDFVKAYDDWVMRRYVKVPRPSVLRQRLEKSHSIEFTTLEKKKQPNKLNGGELMRYQLDGLNWLYYRWWSNANAILADEMGLGKTIQVIGFLATLIQDHNCFPFLIVVSNGTVPNWRREIKQWAPSIRVVTYYGSSISRSMAYQHELYPNGARELRCHVVVTSYEAAADENCRRFFRGVNWQGLIVDEGQRLKSDKTILYDALSALKVPWRMLLTGTPLQNNARELFNLLQFLDDTFDAGALEIEYSELTRDNVPRLHEMIRPFFLRRTKAQVLTFLPPMAQVVLPVSMSSLQAKLYKSILSRNPDLIKALYDPSSKGLGKTERASLANVLMQLRKCLCHPFVYSNEIEELTDIAVVSHRNLVEASAKLQLLELLLPKLQQRGHRVLIFSQFLNMLDIVEDFLDGLTLGYARLDGNVPAMEKQKRIDAFNAPNSPLFAFLLSTRAGGVGINLATADTVLIMDPDFNPHADIQALSRAHRIGQKNKVLCFQLMTRASAEEKIVQIGRKKMALDHLLIEQMDNEDDTPVDVESVLRYGAADILEGKTQEIRYDEASIDKLLDRSAIEDTGTGDDSTAESQFSFARVWANDNASLVDSLESDSGEEKAPDPTVWDRILKEREAQAAEEAKARQEMLGKGRRARKVVDYGTLEEDHTPRKDKGKGIAEESSDTDFQADDDKKDEQESADEGPNAEIDEAEVAEMQVDHPPPQQHETRTGQFRRAAIRWPGPGQPNPLFADTNGDIDFYKREERERQHPVTNCYVCSTHHRQGFCPLKLAGPEFCNLCGLAHYGDKRSCPHIRSETQVREMLVALKQSPESRGLIDLAKKYLTGVKGTLVQEKKKKLEKAAFENAPRATQANGQSRMANGISTSQENARRPMQSQPPRFQMPQSLTNENGQRPG